MKSTDFGLTFTNVPSSTANWKQIACNANGSSCIGTNTCCVGKADVKCPFNAPCTRSYTYTLTHAQPKQRGREQLRGRLLEQLLD